MSQEPRPNASIGELFSSITTTLTGLVRGEIELAQAQATDKAKVFGPAIGMFAAAGVLALFGLGWLFATAFWGLAEALPHWASALIVAVVIFLVVAVLALVGKKAVDKAKALPLDAKENLRKDLEAIKPNREEAPAQAAVPAPVMPPARPATTPNGADA